MTTTVRSTLDLPGAVAWWLRDLGWGLIHAGDRIAHEDLTDMQSEFTAGVGYGRPAAEREYFDKLLGVVKLAYDAGKGDQPLEAARIIEGTQAQVGAS